MSSISNLELYPEESGMCSDCPVLKLRVNVPRTKQLGEIVTAVCKSEDLLGDLPSVVTDPKDFAKEAAKMAKNLGASAGIPIVGTNEQMAVLSCVMRPLCPGTVNN